MENPPLYKAEPVSETKEIENTRDLPSNPPLQLGQGQ